MTDINTAALELAQAEIARLREALERIAAVRYSDDRDADPSEYWSDVALDYRAIARKALKTSGAPAGRPSESDSDSVSTAQRSAPDPAKDPA